MNEQEIKVLVTDLDGTLLAEDREDISQKLQVFLKKWLARGGGPVRGGFGQRPRYARRKLWFSFRGAGGLRTGNKSCCLGQRGNNYQERPGRWVEFNPRNKRKRGKKTVKVEKKWVVRSPDPAAVAKIEEGLDCSELLAALLVNRGITSPADAREFLYPSEAGLLCRL